ncbi:hypothetical protein MTO98_26025 [Mucilaginibacter sp. SMC90]|uniref:hypothetical protein n=1 Tax=Mucilaginibacter sp. SMC90 TaxID=2929803 RepID=UPI001FB47814|nr:hypothetical protein [Mucilaginibacter sp. SMC90]UOE47873.1 hypothetical protein MTO98_26025 [Mucilaginibacter sp. SMC90]
MLKTVYISWLGTQKEWENNRHAEFEEARAKNPGLEFKVKITSVVLIPPPPIPDPTMHPEKTMELIDSNTTGINLNEEVIEQVRPKYVESEQDYRTKVEYEKALNRAIAIFEAQPNTPEFEELRALLPLLIHYEDTKLILPELDIADVIRLSIKNFNLPRPMLKPIIGNEEDVDLFLKGKQQLPEETLKLICNSLGIRY